jgi:hypothetical protein
VRRAENKPVPASQRTEKPSKAKDNHAYATWDIGYTPKEDQFAVVDSLLMKYRKQGQQYKPLTRVQSKPPSLRRQLSLQTLSLESAVAKPRQSPMKEDTIMNYYYKLSARSGKTKPTPYNHQKRAASRSGYRTKLQRDPMLRQGPLGYYQYDDAYKTDQRVKVSRRMGSGRKQWGL